MLPRSIGNLISSVYMYTTVHSQRQSFSARAHHRRLLELDFWSKVLYLAPHTRANQTTPTMVNYFRITLMRSAIGLPRKRAGVLKALGLHKRLRTVYHPVSPDVAGQIFAVKELVDVQEVDQSLTRTEMKELRRPDTGFYVERRASDARGEA